MGVSLGYRPPAELPAPAVQPKQCGPTAMRRPAKTPRQRRNRAGRAGRNRQIEHLVEVAVVERAVPADRERVAAHDAGGRGGVEGVDEALQVGLEVARLASSHSRKRLIGMLVIV